MFGTRVPSATPTIPRGPTNQILSNSLHAASNARPGISVRCLAIPVSECVTTARDAPSHTTIASIRRTSPEVGPYAGPIQRVIKDSPRNTKVAAIDAARRVASLATERISFPTLLPPKDVRALTRGVITYANALVISVAYPHKLPAIAKK